MATKFDTLVDAIIADYVAATADTTTTFARGQLKRSELAEERRVVFVRDGGEIVASKHSSSMSATPIASREETVVAHIYAPDDATAETILENLVRSYDRCLGSAWVERSAEYVWYTQTEDGARWETAGSLIRLATRWRLGLTEEAAPQVVLDAVSHVNTLGLGEFGPDFDNAFRFAGAASEIGCSS